jgi:hypothetical protein
MAGLTFSIDPRVVRSKLPKQRKEECIEYLNLFVETFDNRFMSNTFNRIHKSTWLSNDQAANIKKRSANIVLTQDIQKNALRYIATYWKMLLPLKIGMAHSKFRPSCASFILEKSNDMLPFFESYGYISKAQYESFLRRGTFTLERIEETLKASSPSPSIIKEMKELYQIIIPKIDKLVLPGLAKRIPKKWAKKTSFGWLGNELKRVSNLSNLTATMVDRNIEMVVGPLTTKDVKAIKAEAISIKNLKKAKQKTMSLESFREQFEV